MLTIYPQDIPNFKHKTIQINKSSTNQPKKISKKYFISAREQATKKEKFESLKRK